jgi:F420-non-reducing hydrogenase iron-sulfur subunit
MNTKGTFKPRMLGFVCNWCCYGGADLAGVSRFQYPPYIRLIRVMCSARVDLSHIFRAFLTGQDAVFIGGCHLNDCHYVTAGNYDALSTVHIAKKMLEQIGVNPVRLRLEWVSAGEGIRFANIMNEFAPEIEKLGPLGSSEGLGKKGVAFKLKAAMRLIPYIKLVQTERLCLPIKNEETYQNFFKSESFSRLFNESISDKLTLSQIMMLIREKPLSTRKISEALGLHPSEVVRHLNHSARQGWVRYNEQKKCYTLTAG